MYRGTLSLNIEDEDSSKILKAFQAVMASCKRNGVSFESLNISKVHEEPQSAINLPGEAEDTHEQKFLPPIYFGDGVPIDLALPARDVDPANRVGLVFRMFHGRDVR